MTSPHKSRSTLECKRCGGWGWFVFSKRMCPICHGSGKVAHAAAKAKRGKGK